MSTLPGQRSAMALAFISLTVGVVMMVSYRRSEHGHPAESAKNKSVPPCLNVSDANCLHACFAHVGAEFGLQVKYLGALAHSDVRGAVNSASNQVHLQWVFDSDVSTESSWWFSIVLEPASIDRMPDVLGRVIISGSEWKICLLNASSDELPSLGSSPADVIEKVVDAYIESDQN